jgi:hypothetical protein
LTAAPEARHQRVVGLVAARAARVASVAPVAYRPGTAITAVGPEAVVTAGAAQASEACRLPEVPEGTAARLWTPRLVGVVGPRTPMVAQARTDRAAAAVEEISTIPPRAMVAMAALALILTPLVDPVAVAVALAGATVTKLATLVTAACTVAAAVAGGIRGTYPSLGRVAAAHKASS